MTRLGAADLEAVLSFLEEAQAVEGPAPFTPELLDRLTEVVHCEYATFSAVDRASRTVVEYIPCSAEEGRGPELDDEWWACGRTVKLWRRKSGNGTQPVVLSHVFNRRQRMRSDFNPNVRDWGVVDEIHVDLDPPRQWKAELSVSSSRDFGPRERLILQLVHPHLAAVYRAAELRRRLSEASGTLDPDAFVHLTPREREVMRRVADGLSNAEIALVLVVERSTVRKHLEHVYEKLGVRSRTAALAKLRGP